MLCKENYLNECQNTEFKRAFINVIKTFKVFRKDMKTQLNELKESKSKLPSEVQNDENVVHTQWNTIQLQRKVKLAGKWLKLEKYFAEWGKPDQKI